MLRLKSCYTLLLILVFLQGCASLRPADVAQPSEVTLEQALESVGKGLHAMRRAQEGYRTGLMPVEVEVKFDLAASAKDTGKLTIDLSKAVTIEPVKKDEKLGGSLEQSSEAKRSNSISIKFTNLLTLPKDTLVHVKTADEIEKIVAALEKANIQLFTVDPEFLKQLGKRLAEDPKMKEKLDAILGPRL